MDFPALSLVLLCHQGSLAAFHLQLIAQLEVLFKQEAQKGPGGLTG